MAKSKPKLSLISTWVMEESGDVIDLFVDYVRLEDSRIIGRAQRSKLGRASSLGGGVVAIVKKRGNRADCETSPRGETP